MGTLSPAGLTPFQLAAILANTIVCMTIHIMPRLLASRAGTGAWLATAAGGLATLALSGLILVLTERFAGATYVAFLPRLFGAWPARVTVALLGLYRIAVLGIIVRLFGEFINTAVLTRTPPEVIIGVMLGLTTYQSRQTIAAFARLQEITFIPLLLVIVVILAPGLQNVRYMNLLPLWGDSVEGLLAALPPTALSYLGFEALLYFYGLVTPSGVHRRQARWSVVAGVVIPMVLYVGITELGVGVFGAVELGQWTWPVLELIRAAEIPGFIIERMDAPFVTLWVAVLFTSVATYHFLATQEFAAVLRLHTPSVLALPVAVVSLAAAMLPTTMFDVELAAQLVAYVGFGLTVAIVLLALLSAWIRGVGGKV